VSSIRWRWEEKDFGFRFRSGTGKGRAEYYQSAVPSSFYIVPTTQAKLSKERMDQLGADAKMPASAQVVASPWRDYHLGWDWVKTEEGICLNYAGCLHQEEINRREDEGVARAMEFVASLLGRSEPGPTSTPLIRQIHTELMGDIYPFAGEWRTVSLHKGDGPTKWPLPPSGIEPVMEIYERDVLSRTPFLSVNNDAVYLFCSEVMNELLAIHPFREGNGRAAFILGNFILMQNDLLPLDIYDQRRHRDAYYSACEAGRLHKHYEPLATLIGEWEEEAITRWEETNGR
jgi:cell filamentation protein